MKKLLLYFLASLIACLSHGQNKTEVTKVDFKKYKTTTQLEGKVKQSYRFTDTDGEHLVVLTETGIYKKKGVAHEEDGMDASLYAYHFLVKKDSAIQTWKIYDHIDDCPVDLEASFVSNSFQVTDLDKDGRSEIWMIYRTVCYGDISPKTMKLIMYEGNQKFAMRGETKVFAGTNEQGKREYLGGNYTFDEAFAKAPASFREQAKKLWKLYMVEK